MPTCARWSRVDDSGQIYQYIMCGYINMWCVWHVADIVCASRTVCIQILGIFWMPRCARWSCIHNSGQIYQYIMCGYINMWCVWHGTDILRESRTLCIQVLGIFRSANVCALGPSRRYLLLPEEKARIAASKILAWDMKHLYETWHVHIDHGDLTPLRSVCCLTRRCASLLVRSWRETCRNCMREDTLM